MLGNKNPTYKNKNKIEIESVILTLDFKKLNI